MTTVRRILTPLIASLALVLATLLPAGTPANAATPDVWAFAYMDNATPGVGWVMDLTRQSGTWKSTSVCASAVATVTAFSTGIYQVTFPCSASGNGVAHVTAVDYKGRYCTIGTWYASGTSEIVDVFCYDATGVPDNATFTVLYTTSSGVPTSGGGHAYVYSDFSGAPLSNYNSTGTINSITHPSAGVYLVKIPNLSIGTLYGDLQATAVHPNQLPRRCKVARWTYSGSDYYVYVFCFNNANALTDTWFTLSLHQKRSVYGALYPPKYYAYTWYGNTFVPPATTDYNSTGGVNSTTWVGTGNYHVIFPQVGLKETHIQVTAYGTTPDYCQLYQPWYISGVDVVQKTVICFDGLGNVKDNSFFISTSSSV